MIYSVKGRVTAEGDSDANKWNKKLTFAPFRSYISKSNNTFTKNGEDFHKSDNYSMTSGRFWNYYRDKVNDDAIEINSDNYITGNSKTVTSESFEYNTKIIGHTAADNNILK